MKTYKQIAEEVAALVEEKNAAYGDSFNKCSQFLQLLFPSSVPATKYKDMLAIVRVFDKLMRIATKPNAFGESPWQDVLGYALLALHGQTLNAEELEAALEAWSKESPVFLKDEDEITVHMTAKGTTVETPDKGVQHFGASRWQQTDIKDDYITVGCTPVTSECFEALRGAVVKYLGFPVRVEGVEGMVIFEASDLANCDYAVVFDLVKDAWRNGWRMKPAFPNCWHNVARAGMPERNFTEMGRYLLSRYGYLRDKHRVKVAPLNPFNLPKDLKPGASFSVHHHGAKDVKINGRDYPSHPDLTLLFTGTRLRCTWRHAEGRLVFGLPDTGKDAVELFERTVQKGYKWDNRTMLWRVKDRQLTSMEMPKFLREEKIRESIELKQEFLTVTPGSLGTVVGLLKPGDTVRRFFKATEDAKELPQDMKVISAQGQERLDAGCITSVKVEVLAEFFVCDFRPFHLFLHQPGADVMLDPFTFFRYKSFYYLPEDDRSKVIIIIEPVPAENSGHSGTDNALKQSVAAKSPQEG
jgi:hypothetical protein